MRTEELPEQFLESMKRMLGTEYQDYLDSMKENTRTAFRVNTNKITPEHFMDICPFQTEPVPWNEKGFYYNVDADVPSKHPYYYAGLYYIQEPSAMIPASLLPVAEGDRVLDLCAAPGGKATELAAKLHGTGLLVANDISVSRAMALAKNLQIAGTRNAVVTAETPENLAAVLSGFFQKVLIDAPCSGEGMFRRDPGMVKSWLTHGPEYYAAIQTGILESAYELLAPGGDMVYSTCTFSPLEDEGMILSFLKQHPDMTICEVPRYPGYSEGRPDWVPDGDPALKNCVRIFPHRAEGEGHFAVLLHKQGETGSVYAESEMWDKNGTVLEKGRGNEDFSDRKKRRKQTGKKGRNNISGRQENKQKRQQKDQESIENFFQQLLPETRTGVRDLSRKKDMYVTDTLEADQIKGLRVVAGGLIIGNDKNGRFEPSPQLALALRGEDYLQRIDLPAEDERVIRYLKGETVLVDKPYKGYVLFCVDGYPLGWCKGNGSGTMKNKYYPGWRMQ